MAASFKAALGAGPARLCGIWSSLNSPTVAEILAGSAADWVLLDMEHGVADPASVLAQLQASAAFPTPMLVRPPSDDPVMVKRLLDLGCVNLLIPMVNDAEQARRAVAATRYPPAGIRGVAAGARASGYGRERDYLDQANQRISLVVQIESADAVENADGILGVEGIDAVFVGPADLSASMGHLGEPGHPDVEAAIGKVVEAGKRLGKPLGVFAGSAADARRRFDQGFAFVAVSSDVKLLVAGVAETLAAVRGEA